MIRTNSPIGPAFSLLNVRSNFPSGIDYLGESATVPVAPHPHQGVWVWTKEDLGGSLAARFAKSFVLKGEVKKAHLWVSADSKYRLWINGRLVARGPSDPGRDYDSGPPGPWYDDIRDVQPLLHNGENIIAIEVFAKPLVQSDATLNKPGFKLDLSWTDAAGRHVIASDETWHYISAPDLTPSKDGTFTIDLAKEPKDWRYSTSGAQFSSPTHQRATILSNLPPPLEETLRPLTIDRVSGGVVVKSDNSGASSRVRHSITVNGEGAFSAGFGRVLSGYVTLRVETAGSGTITIMPNERNAPGFHRKSIIKVAPGTHEVELPFFDSFSTINVKVEGATKSMNLMTNAVFTSFPVQYRGDFKSEDDELNALWSTCRWVTQICMQTHHLDSPHHQEPISDPGDYLIEALVSYYAFGEARLAKQDLQKYGRILHQRGFSPFHTSYALLWLQMLLDYYDYTGDLSLVQELAPTVHLLVDKFASWRGKNGLISEAPNYMFMDWVKIEGFELHHPPAVLGQGYMTALFHRALADDARIARLTKNSDRAKVSERLKSEVKIAFRRELWDTKAGLFIDGKPNVTTIKPGQWLPGDKDIRTYSTQVNALAVDCGLTAAKESEAIMATLLKREDLNCQPYFMHFFFNALAKTSLYETHALTQMKRWKIQPDTRSFLEMWNTGDLSHAWIATPLIQLSQRLLGVRPLEAGFKSFEVKPRMIGPNNVSGKVPTPYGLIEVRWKRQPKFELELTVPKGTNAIVTLPNGKVARFGPGAHGTN